MQQSTRHELEREFHDSAANEFDLDAIPVEETFESITSPEPRYILEQMGELDGRTILDLGCGSGEATVYLALRGATVTSLDISQGMCDTTRRLAERYGVADRVTVVCCPIEHVSLGTQSFDYVYGQGVLHHVDIESAGERVRDLLKPGGRAYFIEPLAYNPAIKVYRRLASGVRTPTEQPLRRSDIARLRGVFPRLTHREFQLMTLGVFVWMYLVERLNPSDVRYWKRIVVEGHRYSRAFRLLEMLDRALVLPGSPLKWWCWNTVIACEK